MAKGMLSGQWEVVGLVERTLKHRRPTRPVDLRGANIETQSMLNVSLGAREGECTWEELPHPHTHIFKRVSLCRPRCPGTYSVEQAGLATPVLRLEMCITTPGTNGINF